MLVNLLVAALLINFSHSQKVYDVYDAVSCRSQKAISQSRGLGPDASSAWCKLYTVSPGGSNGMGTNCMCNEDDVCFDPTVGKQCIFYSGADTTNCNRSPNDQALNDFWCYTMSFSLSTFDSDSCTCYSGRCYDRNTKDYCAPKLNFLEYPKDGDDIPCMNDMDCVLNGVSERTGQSVCSCNKTPGATWGLCKDANNRNFRCVRKPTMKTLLSLRRTQRKQ